MQRFTANTGFESYLAALNLLATPLPTPLLIFQPMAQCLIATARIRSMHCIKTPPDPLNLSEKRPNNSFRHGPNGGQKLSGELSISSGEKRMVRSAPLISRRSA